MGAKLTLMGLLETSLLKGNWAVSGGAVVNVRCKQRNVPVGKPATKLPAFPNCLLLEQRASR